MLILFNSTVLGVIGKGSEAIAGVGVDQLDKEELRG